MFAFTMRFPGHGREHTHPRTPGSHRRFGGHGEGETPGPIPNPEVKPFSADGTALETVWESRTPPDTYIDQESPPDTRLAGFPAFGGSVAPSLGLSALIANEKPGGAARCGPPL